MTYHLIYLSTIFDYVNNETNERGHTPAEAFKRISCRSPF